MIDSNIFMKSKRFLISLLILYLMVNILFYCGKWLFFSADWTVLTENFELFILGNFPEEQRWRPLLWLFYFLTLSFLSIFRSKNLLLTKFISGAWILYLPIGLWLLAGGLGLVPVSSRFWGGLILTIFLTVSSLFFSLPFGIVLALGRQSKLPIINRLSIIYINIMRGVPLISVLFFGQLLIPLFLPTGLEINRVVRTIIAFTLFLSAYIAEDVRGGLQAISNNQIEAAKALGLNATQVKLYVIIPQAIKIAIPALTNQVVGLLQNTSLMSILGLVELLGISRSLLANPKFIGHYLEVYVWLAAVYWFFCTLIALLGRHLETTMNYEDKQR